MTATDTGTMLLRAVCTQPAEDTPRLVYADYLEENGEPDRAEFIRVQCELARDPDRERACRAACEPPDFDLCPQRDLRRRERELWGRLPTCRAFAPWASGISTDPAEPRFRLGDQTGPLCVVRRGFVESVTATLAALFGGPCGRCGGNGRLPAGGLAPAGSDGPCPDCGGTGTAPGCAADLFARQPVTEVRLSDREAGDDAGQEWYWVRGYDPRAPGTWGNNPYLTPESDPSVLPPELFDRVAVPDRADMGEWLKIHPSESAANEHLSRAAVDHARSLVPWGSHYGCGRCKAGWVYGVGWRRDGVMRNAWADCPGCDGTGRRGLPPLYGRG